VSCTCMLCSWVGGLNAFVFFSSCALGRTSNKPILSVAGDDSVNTHQHLVCPASNLSQSRPASPYLLAVYPSISMNHAHIPHWRGEAMAMWCLLAVSCWQCLSGGEKRFSVIKHA
jgi:hypothetical protein